MPFSENAVGILSFLREQKQGYWNSAHSHKSYRGRDKHNKKFFWITLQTFFIFSFIFLMFEYIISNNILWYFDKKNGFPFYYQIKLPSIKQIQP